MLERLHQAQIPIAWVVADTVYGNNLDLRIWLEAHQYSFVLAVANTEPSVQNDRLRSRSPTFLQRREKHLALVTKAEPFQLLTLS